MNKGVIVIYHSKDFDGLFSREIARRYFGESAEYVGWNYGEPTPVVPPGVQIYMIDVSVPELMQRPGLVWIDHHLSAMLDYGTEIAGYRVNGVAACRLAWQLFFGGHPRVDEMPNFDDFTERRVSEPWAVRLAGEYDVWDKRDPDAELFQHGLRSCDPDFQRLLNGDNAYVRELLEGGRVLQFARTRENESIIRTQGFTVRFEGLTFLACNAARFNSLLFTAGLSPEHDACLGFCWNGTKWKVSMYGVPGKPEIDLAAIAKRYGGGGHKQACGFECSVLPFGGSQVPVTHAAVVSRLEDEIGLLNTRLTAALAVLRGGMNTFGDFGTQLNRLLCKRAATGVSAQEIDDMARACFGPQQATLQAIRDEALQHGEYNPIGGKTLLPLGYQKIYHMAESALSPISNNE